MNLFSKFPTIPFTFLALAFTLPASAVNVMAIYTAACKRELGTIIRVNDQKVDFLTLSGKTEQIRSHEIIYLAYYPLDKLPLKGSIKPNNVSRVQVYTKHNNSITPLTRGWPIGFTKDKISFLTDEGEETLINRRNIYKIKMMKLTRAIQQNTKEANRYNFIHPYIFSHCDRPRRGFSSIYPQQVLSNTIMIKRELDHLAAGYKKVLRYHREQDFYPLPEVYKNETSLALWHSVGSRYGASSRRTNNVTPLLTDSYSSDIFDYQHTFSTGSGPMFYSMHEEPQTHLYYAFKASYFHFSSMIDPSLILVGKKYKWDRSDFTRDGGLANPVSMIEMGFDVGNFALNLYIMDVWQIGILNAGDLVVESIGVPRLGMTYGNHLHKISFSAGQGSSIIKDAFASTLAEVMSGSLLRINYESSHFKQFELMYSFISRTVDYTSASTNYSNESITNAIYGSYAYKQRYKFGGFFAIESFSESMQNIQSSNETFIKIGAFASLSF